MSGRPIARSVLSNWLGLSLNILIGFLMVPFVVHRLGDISYGIWALVLQITGYMGVVDVGVRSAVVRFVSRFYAKRNQLALNHLLSTTLMLYGAFAVLCLLGGVVLAAVLLPLLQIPASLLEEARITLLLATATLAVSFPLGTFPGILAGLSRWDLRNLVDIVTLFLRTGLIVIFLLAGYGLITLAVIHLVTSAAGYGLGVILVRRLLPGLRLSWRLARQRMLRPVVGHSSYALLISLGNKISYEIDTVVIAAFLPIQHVTAYVIGFKLIQYLRLLVNASTLIVNPLASRLEAEGRTAELGELLVRGSKYCLLLAFPINVGLLLLGYDFIRLWMGESYVETSGTVLAILALGQFISLTQNMGAHLLYGLSKHRVNVWCTGAEAILNLGISLALVQRFGIYGVAVGTSVATVIVRGWFFPAAFLRILKVPWSVYLRYAIWPVFLPALFFGLGVLAFRALFATDHIGTLTIAAASGGALYLPAFWFFGLDMKERAMIRFFFMQRIRKEGLLSAQTGTEPSSSN